MRSYGITDIGRNRNMNQDFIFYSDEPVGMFPNLYIVADGMGGHKAGDYASSFSVERFVQFVREKTDSHLVLVMRQAIEAVNEELLEKSESNDDYKGMGTTFVAAVIEDNTMYVMNIGDSRLYVAGNKLKQITMDHSLVEEMI
ncbi:MAG: serine/threonine-protein phosphatase, partial [Clostridiales bacterium]|nr:serine/threonine-protein phosphatase [Clostridiales bacterium]